MEATAIATWQTSTGTRGVEVTVQESDGERDVTYWKTATTTQRHQWLTATAEILALATLIREGGISEELGTTRIKAHAKRKKEVEDACS